MAHQLPKRIPKRSDELIRRNIPETPVTKIQASGLVRVPALGIKDPHPLVRDLYRSLKNSAQSRFYEPSDWAYARLTLLFVDDLLKQPKKSSMMLASVDSMLRTLLLTEGERRRVHLEVDRNTSGELAAVTDIADVYRERLKG
jgi:hypothetical protein